MLGFVGLGASRLVYHADAVAGALLNFGSDHGLYQLLRDVVGEFHCTFFLPVFVINIEVMAIITP